MRHRTSSRPSTRFMVLALDLDLDLDLFLSLCCVRIFDTLFCFTPLSPTHPASAPNSRLDILPILTLYLIQILITILQTLVTLLFRLNNAFAQTYKPPAETRCVGPALPSAHNRHGARGTVQATFRNSPSCPLNPPPKQSQWQQLGKILLSDCRCRHCGGSSLHRQLRQ